MGDIYLPLIVPCSTMFGTLAVVRLANDQHVDQARVSWPQTSALELPTPLGNRSWGSEYSVVLAIAVPVVEGWPADVSTSAPGCVNYDTGLVSTSSACLITGKPRCYRRTSVCEVGSMPLR